MGAEKKENEDYGLDLILGHSFEGCPHFKINFRFSQEKPGKAKLAITSTNANEVDFLKQMLQVQNRDQSKQTLIFNEQNEVEIEADAILYCDGYPIVTVKDLKAQQNKYIKKPLPEFRLLSVYNQERTVTSLSHSAFYEALVKISYPPSKRLDAHTHMIGTYPMRFVLERAMELNENPKGSLYMPSFVVLHILKAQKIIHSNNENEWQGFLRANKTTYSARQFGKQKDSSKELIQEDFNRQIENYLSPAEQEICYSNQEAYYIDLKTLKDRLGPSQWGDFCNGFDLDATFPCDFTEHMEMSYVLRNWFGKDPHFLQAQLESIYDLYEKQGVHYAELPASAFKRQADVSRFNTVTKGIEQARAAESKETIILRPSLSIARGISPALFRKSLFDYISIILQNPDIASITVLAHEVNPTTSHLEAIKEFTKIINAARPGFTVEIHAGETQFYGEVNLYESRNIARGAKSTIVRAGHAIFGDHNEMSPDNHIEERCPLSNATLIDQSPSVIIDSVLGIANGKTNMFWGSDGCIYEPECGPESQEAFFKALIAHPICVEELEKRFKAKPPALDTYGKKKFDDFLEELAVRFNDQLARNRALENHYIDFKSNEKKLHALRLIVNYLQDSSPKTLSHGLGKQALDFVNEAQKKAVEGYLPMSFWLARSQTRLDALYNDFKTTALDLDIEVSSLQASQMSLEIKKQLLKGIEVSFHALQDKEQDLSFNQSTIFNYLRNLVHEKNSQTSLDEWLAKEEVSSKLLTYYKYLLHFNRLDASSRLSHSVNTASSIRLSSRFLDPENLSNEVRERAASKLIAAWMSPTPEERKALEFFSSMYKLHQYFLETEDSLQKPSWYREIEEDLLAISDDMASIIRFVNSLSPKLKMEMENYINQQGIHKKAFQGHPYSEMILDTNWAYQNQYSIIHDANQRQLEQHSKNRQEMDGIQWKDNLKTKVLFGEPEHSPDFEKQKEYMSKLHNSLYRILQIQLQDQGSIILLGGIEDGINPLIYKIIKEHPELSKIQIRHVLAANESAHSVDKKQHPNLFKEAEGYVSYLIVPNSRREESHIAYADFIEKNNISDLNMFGNDAIWSDTKIVLDQRRNRNGERLKDKINYYEDGFGKTRTSHAYAQALISQSRPEQVLKAEKKTKFAEMNELAKSSTYSAKLFKTMPVYKNLNLTWMALNALSPIEDSLPQERFFKLFYPINQVLNHKKPFFNSAEEKQAIAKAFIAYITELISKADTNKLNQIEKLFNRYGTMLHMEKILVQVANFDLRGAIEEHRMHLNSPH